MDFAKAFAARILTLAKWIVELDPPLSDLLLANPLVVICLGNFGNCGCCRQCCPRRSRGKCEYPVHPDYWQHDRSLAIDQHGKLFGKLVERLFGDGRERRRPDRWIRNRRAIGSEPHFARHFGNQSIYRERLGQSFLLRPRRIQPGRQRQLEQLLGDRRGQRVDYLNDRRPHAQRPDAPRRDVHDHHQFRHALRQRADVHRRTSPASVSITATNGTINLGPGNGSLSVGGKPLDPTDETTLDGYTGTITVSASGDGTDTVTLNGNAGNVLQVSATPNTFTTDQNTPVTFQANVQTSLADTYNLTANAPPGWTVTIDTNGNVTATPAPGLQSGTYPIQIIAQSTTNPNLVAQTTVNVTITPTQPGINFTVAPDPLFTVPFNGAEVPTAFRPTIQNLGPAADTYNLTFSNPPAGFTILNSGTSVTVPAGQTGILGVYLQPNGSQLPAPGTVVSFTVTATSTSDSTITQQVTVQYTVPNIDAVTLASDVAQVNTVPGMAGAATLTVTNAGNVPETIDFSSSSSTGLTVDGLQTLTLNPGDSGTEVISLTPSDTTAAQQPAANDHHGDLRPSRRPGDANISSSGKRRRARCGRHCQRRDGRCEPRRRQSRQSTEQPQRRPHQPGAKPDRSGLQVPGPRQPAKHSQPSCRRSDPRRVRAAAVGRGANAGERPERDRRPIRRRGPRQRPR